MEGASTHWGSMAARSLHSKASPVEWLGRNRLALLQNVQAARKYISSSARTFAPQPKPTYCSEAACFKLLWRHRSIMSQHLTLLDHQMSNFAVHVWFENVPRVVILP